MRPPAITSVREGWAKGAGYEPCRWVRSGAACVSIVDEDVDMLQQARVEVVARTSAARVQGAGCRVQGAERRVPSAPASLHAQEKSMACAFDGRLGALGGVPHARPSLQRPWTAVECLWPHVQCLAHGGRVRPHGGGMPRTARVLLPTRAR